MPDRNVSPQNAEERHGLLRGLGLWAAVAVVIGDTIGSGIFLVSSDTARIVGSTALVFAAWIFGGLIVLCGAFCYAELGALFPKAGGPYAYLTRGLGPMWGFLFGWMSAFLERPVAMATLAAGFLRFLGFVFPAVASPFFTVHFAGGELTVTLAQPLAACVVIAVTALNYLSVKMGGAIQMALTSIKVGTIVLIVLGGFLFGSRHEVSVAPLAAASPASWWTTIVAVLSALVPAMWAYNGFNDLGHLGEEVIEPQKNIPRAILLGLGSIGALYLLANVVYFRVLSFAQVAASAHVASDAVRTFAGERGAIALTIAMAISALGALHVVVMTGARIPYAMARDGVFFKFAERLHPKLRTPSGSLMFLGTVAALLALSGTYEQLYSLFVFALWIFFALTAIALIRLRATEPELARPFRAWGFPVTPIVFLLAAIALTANLWMQRPIRSTLGVLVILAGVPFYFRWRSAILRKTKAI
ncbi:MAG TPA: amino acid permease [Candidatus Acidoferrum sp.]|nr:amino acid permease [Candidatus Acidoferrum sp.]